MKLTKIIKYRGFILAISQLNNQSRLDRILDGVVQWSMDFDQTGEITSSVNGDDLYIHIADHLYRIDLIQGVIRWNVLFDKNSFEMVVWNHQVVLLGHHVTAFDENSGSLKYSLAHDFQTSFLSKSSNSLWVIKNSESGPRAQLVSNSESDSFVNLGLPKAHCVSAAQSLTNFICVLESDAKIMNIDDQGSLKTVYSFNQVSGANRRFAVDEMSSFVVKLSIQNVSFLYL
jgi:hypothetical protein